jgi:hypothetical protein
MKTRILIAAKLIRSGLLQRACELFISCMFQTKVSQQVSCKEPDTSVARELESTKVQLCLYKSPRVMMDRAGPPQGCNFLHVGRIIQLIKFGENPNPILILGLPKIINLTQLLSIQWEWNQV